jgi:hypothetical protein
VLLSHDIIEDDTTMILVQLKEDIDDATGSDATTLLD